MKLNDFMRGYASEINGNYSECDDQRSVIIVPLGEDRFQAVIGEMTDDKERINISSKVCEAGDDIDYKELLVINHKTSYGKFAISNSFLKVETSLLANETDTDSLKEIIMEVAELADSWELKLTGKDIF